MKGSFWMFGAPRSSKSSEPFIVRENRGPIGSPAVVLNLCPSEGAENERGRPTLGLRLPFPLKTSTWCSDKKAF